MRLPTVVILGASRCRRADTAAATSAQSDVPFVTSVSSDSTLENASTRAPAASCTSFTTADTPAGSML